MITSINGGGPAVVGGSRLLGRPIAMRLTSARAVLCSAAVLAVPLLTACQSDGCIDQPNADGGQVCVHLPNGGGPDEPLGGEHARIEVPVR